MEAALRDITARGLESHETPQLDQPAPQDPAPAVIAEAEPPVPLPLSSRELAAALQPGPTPAPSGGTVASSDAQISRRSGLLSSHDDVHAPQGEATASAQKFRSTHARTGWHQKEGIVIQVATPRPNILPADYPLRSSFARFDRMDLFGSDFRRKLNI